MLIEAILLINPESQRRKELEIQNQLSETALIETINYSNCSSNQLFNISHVDYIEKSIVREIMEISQLEDNWNGFGTSQISSDVINNALNIVSLLRPTVLCHLSPENVYPSKFGTIIMDWDFGNGNIFSLEIAKQSIGYFTEYRGEPQIQKDCINFNFDNNNSEIINSIHSDIAQFI